jgi:transcriptional regulator with XRE-family HTH domain
MKNINSNFVPAISHTSRTSGETIRMLRILKHWSRKDMAVRSCISESNLRFLENDSITLKKKYAEQIANSFGIHPAIIKIL